MSYLYSLASSEMSSSLSQWYSSFGLLFQPSNDLSITVYSDANWVTNIGDRKSIVAYCVFIAANLVLWSLKKQTVVSSYSVESEYQLLP